MLKSMQIKNFKGWKDTGHIRLAPLTVIFGANSAGKSSLGHLLLALKQTAQSNDNKRALHLGDDKSMIDLGTFKECLHNHDLSQPLFFQLEWQKKIEIKNPIDKSSYLADRISLEVEFFASKNEQPHVCNISS
jgi:AAA15 family ATPase/GTPase